MLKLFFLIHLQGLSLFFRALGHKEHLQSLNDEAPKHFSSHIRRLGYQAFCGIPNYLSSTILSTYRLQCNYQMTVHLGTQNTITSGGEISSIKISRNHTIKREDRDECFWMYDYKVFRPSRAIAGNLPTTSSVGSPLELPVTSVTRYTKGLKETPFNATAFKCWLLKSKRVTAKKASKQWNTLPGSQQGVSSKGSEATTKK